MSYTVEALDAFFGRARGQLQEIVNLSSSTSQQSPTWLDTYYPMETVPSFQVLHGQMKVQPTVAQVVSLGAAIPTKRKRFDMDVIRQDGIKIGHSCCFDENDLDRARKYDLDTAVLGAAAQGLQQILFPSLASLSPGIMQRADALFVDMLATGDTNYVDAITGDPFNLSYPVDPALFAPATTAWSNVAATGLQDLETRLRLFLTVNRSLPRAMVMSTKTICELIAQDATKAILGQTIFYGAGNANPPARVTQAMVQDYINSYIGLVQIIIDDSTYFDEQADGSVIERPYIPADTVIFLYGPEQNDATNKAITAPSLNNRLSGRRYYGPHPSNEGRPGVYLSTERKSLDPILWKMTASAMFLPVVFQPSRLGALYVGA